MDDLQKAYEKLNSKRNVLTTYYHYVNGPQPLRYSTERLYQAFDDITTHFEINWCSVIVDTTTDRLNLMGFSVAKDATAQKWMAETFDKIQLLTESQEVHKAALGYTQGYLIIWPDEDKEIEVYYNDPRMVEIFYDPGHPKKKLFAAKWFKVNERKQEITLYYPDVIKHYVANVEEDKDPSVKDFGLSSEEENEYGVIPVFEFKTRGEITSVISLQDAVNKIFADMMVAGEFGAFVQRWVISQADPSDLENGPNKIWWVPAADSNGQQSSVGQFTPTDLEGYLNAMDRIANAMFVITRTPKHYLMESGSNVSGEALIAMEAPLIKKVDKYKKIFDINWKEVAEFIFLLGGFDIPQSSVSPIWKKAESTQPLTEAQATQAMVNTGMPLTTVLKRYGWTEPEIKDLLDDMKKEKENKATMAQSVLDSLRTKTAQENPTGEGTPNPIGENPPVQPNGERLK